MMLFIGRADIQESDATKFRSFRSWRENREPYYCPLKNLEKKKSLKLVCNKALRHNSWTSY